jgi:hypothetical protein
LGNINKLILLFVDIAVFVTAIFITNYMVLEAKEERSAQVETERYITQMRDEREWRKYAGKVSGADMVDFITAHLYDNCEIYIIDNSLITDAVIGPVMTGDILNVKSLPDEAYDTTFLFDRVAGGKKYEAELLINNGNVYAISYTVAAA